MKFKLTNEEMRQINVGDEIRRARNEIFLNQDYMAKKLGICQSTYHRIETGEIRISKERLTQITEILNKPMDYFLNGTGLTEKASNSNMIYVSQREWDFMREVIYQQQKD